MPEGSDFPLLNLPYGIFIDPAGKPRAGTRIGDTVIDLFALANAGLLDGSGIPAKEFGQPTLNNMIAYGKSSWHMLRNTLTDIFEEGNSILRNNRELRKLSLWPVSEISMLMPLSIGDYTDFYSSLEHATNLGKLFRDPANALLPNWRHLPVGYHGRSSSIVISGTPVHRPSGQTRPDDTAPPVFGPTRQLDFELEMAFVTGKKTELGDSVPAGEAEDAIFGFVLFNDLSARDIQKWEYVPLGPFAGKNFGSIISPWIVTLEALEPFRVAGPVQEPEVLPYLRTKNRHNFDIELEVFIQPENGKETRVSRTNYRYMYWNIAQQLAHQTANGCNINVGDLYASGTISGPDEGSFGSMIELTHGGKRPLKLDDLSERTFLNDNDRVIIRGYAQKGDLRIGFGEASVKLLPAREHISSSLKQETQHVVHAD
ncbi:MAG: fumarylacetoacetase [Syntrophothermus sp.]